MPRRIEDTPKSTLGRAQKWMYPRWLSLISFVLLVGVSLGCYYLTCQTETMPTFLRPYWYPVDVLLFCLTIVAFMTTSLIDPGFYPVAPPEEDVEPLETAPLHKEIMVNDVSVKMKWCSTCQFYRPPRCSHCSVCDRCISHHDHHCPWVGTCIGNRNYRYFYYFLVLLLFHMLLIITSIVFYFMDYFDKENNDSSSSAFISSATKPNDQIPTSMNQNNASDRRPAPVSSPDANVSAIQDSTPQSHALSIPSALPTQEPTDMVFVLACAISVITFFFFLFVAGLCGFHSYLITKGRTTHEQVTNRFDEAFSKSCHKNWRRTFCTAIHENYLLGYPPKMEDWANDHISVKLDKTNKPEKQKKSYLLPSGRQRVSTFITGKVHTYDVPEKYEFIANYVPVSTTPTKQKPKSQYSRADEKRFSNRPKKHSDRTIVTGGLKQNGTEDFNGSATPIGASTQLTRVPQPDPLDQISPASSGFEHVKPFNQKYKLSSSQASLPQSKGPHTPERVSGVQPSIPISSTMPLQPFPKQNLEYREMPTSESTALFSSTDHHPVTNAARSLIPYAQQSGDTRKIPHVNGTNGSHPNVQRVERPTPPLEQNSGKPLLEAAGITGLEDDSMEQLKEMAQLDQKLKQFAARSSNPMSLQSMGSRQGSGTMAAAVGSQSSLINNGAVKITSQTQV